MGKGGRTDFEEKFDDVMSYVKVRLDGKGKSVKVRDKEDLRSLIERLDQGRRDQQGSPRMSKTFIQGLVETRKADRLIGQNVGRFGAKPRTLKREQNTIQRYKSQGRTVYRYTGGFAIKSTYKLTPQGKVNVRFRDANTGRFIKKDRVEEEV